MAPTNGPNQAAMRVLLIEDDPMIGAAAQAALKDASCAADWVKNGQMGLSALAAQHYDLVLLDLGLPGKDGLAVLRSLRAQGNPVPVLIITARDGVDDRISGLDTGADDYIVKPFDMGELLARMRAVVRRKGGLGSPVLENGVLALDPAAYTATRVGHAAVQLSKREQLEDRVYGWGEEVESNAIEFLIHALRKKLGSDAIKNVRGAGWMVPKGP